MKFSKNEVRILGIIGNIEFKSINNNIVCNMSVATGHGIKKDDGTWENVTEWHNVVFWGDANCKHLENGKVFT